METQLDGADLVRVILQFCHENGLHQTFAAMQRESCVPYNVVDSVEAFLGDIRAGRWEAVLNSASRLTLPTAKLADLHAQIALELIEARELKACRELLGESAALAWLKASDPGRHKQLEFLLSQPFFNPRDAYPEGTSKEGRRAALADQLAGDVSEAPPSRLVSLVGQALKWQRFSGALPAGERFDVFRDAPPRRSREEEKAPTRLHHAIPFGKSHAEVLTFSEDGFSLISGSVDGFVEVWDPATGKLRRDLAYQASDEYMMHDTAVLALSLSGDGEFLATGSQVRGAAPAGRGPVWMTTAR